MAFDKNRLKNAVKAQKNVGGVEPKPIQEQPQPQYSAVGYQEPVAQQYQPQEQVAPQYQPQPTNPGYAQPMNPGYAQPVNPGYAQPVNPGYAQPMGQGYAQPVPQQQPQQSSVAVAMPMTDVLERIMQNEHVSDINQIEVYEPQSPIIDPIPFKIQDTTGAIGLRVREVEERYNLSVIPFKLAKLNPAIEYIQGYDILRIGDELYASATDHMVNKSTIDQCERKWVDLVNSGRLVEEVLNVTVDIPGYGTINTLLFNRFELDYLHSRFINAGPKVYSVQGTYKFTVGIY